MKFNAILIINPQQYDLKVEQKSLFRICNWQNINNKKRKNANICIKMNKINIVNKLRFTLT